MDDSIAHPGVGPSRVEAPAWKMLLSAGSAFLLAVLFIVAGVWKITDPLSAAERMVQARVPANLGVAAALFFGITETVAGVLLLVPRFRRWGAWLAGGLLVAFVIYIGIHYEALRGEECNCFPWVKRAVGPAFFIGDFIMLAFAVAAGLWAPRSESLRGALIISGAVCVFAGVSYGIVAARQTGARAPETISVDGQPVALRSGRALIYFFDPQCAHCYQAAKEMGTFAWKQVRLVAVPTDVQHPQAPRAFLDETGFRAGISRDVEPLRAVFPFTAGPYAVALEDGYLREPIRNFDNAEPETTLRRLGFID